MKPKHYGKYKKEYIIFAIAVIIAIPLMLIDFSTIPEHIIKFVLYPMAALVVIYVFYVARLWNKVLDEKEKRNGKK